MRFEVLTAVTEHGCLLGCCSVKIQVVSSTEILVSLYDLTRRGTAGETCVER